MITELKELHSKWRKHAVNLREEANRIRRTVKVATGAEERCNVRAEIYDKCADDLYESMQEIISA